MSKKTSKKRPNPKEEETNWVEVRWVNLAETTLDEALVRTLLRADENPSRVFTRAVRPNPKAKKKSKQRRR